jgi:hypothetical protein
MRFLTAARMLFGWSLLLAPLACSTPPAAPAADPDAPPSPTYHVDPRQALGYLASDELEGRGVDTDGINKAADYIANAFRELGLRPAGNEGSYFQSFKMTTDVKPAAGTSLAAKLADDAAPTAYDLKKGFVPLIFSGEGAFDGEVVFAGYGIANAHAGYDDYAGLDVKGKVVVVLRFEPHDEKGKSRFTNGDDWSDDATLNRKLKAAAERGALAVVIVNPVTHHQGDVLMTFARQYMGDGAKLKMLQVTQGVADQWLKAGGAKVDLKSLQAAIDESGKPFKVELSRPVRVSGDVRIEKQQRVVKNVLAVLPGTDKSDAREYLVVGAHYDHLGRGGSGASLARDSEKNAIHNGADDNASGTTAMLELAERFAKATNRPKRSILFAAFTGEESGLIGSERFVDHPTVPLDKVVAMLNLDMVGRVRNNELMVGGQGTAPSFEKFIREADAASPLELKNFGKGGLGPSDHMSFALKKIPVLFFFSGVHPDYHRPTDDADKINYEGLAHVVDVGTELTHRLLAMPRERYVAAADVGGATSMGSGSSEGRRVTLGVIPKYGEADGKGVAIGGTTPGSPAAAAGLKDGDLITGWNGEPMTNLYELTDALRRGKPGDKVKLKVLREGKTIDLEATLAERKG